MNGRAHVDMNSRLQLGRSADEPEILCAQENWRVTLNSRRVRRGSERLYELERASLQSRGNVDRFETEAE